MVRDLGIFRFSLISGFTNESRESGYTVFGELLETIDDDRANFWWFRALFVSEARTDFEFLENKIVGE